MLSTIVGVSAQPQGQYVAYASSTVDPAWRRLPVEERAAMKDAFADVIESWSERFEHLRDLLDDRRPARLRLLPLEDHRALRRPGRARRRAQRHAAGRLARDAVLVPGDDEGVSVHRGAAAAEDHPEGLAVPRRLPVREGAAVVCAAARGPEARDGRAHPRRPRVRDDPQPHDVLVRDRRPGVHDRVRVRRAVRLHAPDADPARERGLGLHRARHADLRRRGNVDPGRARRARRRLRPVRDQVRA